MLALPVLRPSAHHLLSVPHHQRLVGAADVGHADAHWSCVAPLLMQTQESFDAVRCMNLVLLHHDVMLQEHATIFC